MISDPAGSPAAAAPPSRAERIAGVGLAAVLAAAYLGAVAGASGVHTLPAAAGWLALSAVGAGKAIIFAALHPGCRLSAGWLAAAATCAEVGLSAVLLTHIDLLYRIPRLGPRLSKVRDQSARYLTAHPRWKGWAAVGAGIYVALPFAGTGPLGTTFFGQMAGLTRAATLAGIVGGSIASSALTAIGAVVLRDRMEELLRHPALAAAGVILTLGLLGWVGRAMRGGGRE